MPTPLFCWLNTVNIPHLFHPLSQYFNMWTSFFSAVSCNMFATTHFQNVSVASQTCQWTPEDISNCDIQWIDSTLNWILEFFLILFSVRFYEIVREVIWNIILVRLPWKFWQEAGELLKCLSLVSGCLLITYWCGL